MNGRCRESQGRSLGENKPPVFICDGERWVCNVAEIVRISRIRLIITVVPDYKALLTPARPHYLGNYGMAQALGRIQGGLF